MCMWRKRDRQTDRNKEKESADDAAKNNRSVKNTTRPQTEHRTDIEASHLSTSIVFFKVYTVIVIFYPNTGQTRQKERKKKKSKMRNR